MGPEPLRSATKWMWIARPLYQPGNSVLNDATPSLFDSWAPRQNRSPFSTVRSNAPEYVMFGSWLANPL